VTALAIKKIPLRKCTGCHESKPKKELIRIVKSADGEISVDLTGKKAGRGAYICPSVSCLKKAVKAKALERAFDSKVPEEVYAKLEEELSGIAPKEN
jgi:predicted RNA-binding protein YlxR (DUF448 family)